jgi:hypothetical protein
MALRRNLRKFTFLCLQWCTGSIVSIFIWTWVNMDTDTDIGMATGTSGHMDTWSHGHIDTWIQDKGHRDMEVDNWTEG